MITRFFSKKSKEQAFLELVIQQKDAYEQERCLTRQQAILGHYVMAGLRAGHRTGDDVLDFSLRMNQGVYDAQHVNRHKEFRNEVNSQPGAKILIVQFESYVHDNELRTLHRLYLATVADEPLRVDVDEGVLCIPVDRHAYVYSQRFHKEYGRVVLRERLLEQEVIRVGALLPRLHSIPLFPNPDASLSYYVQKHVPFRYLIHPWMKDELVEECFLTQEFVREKMQRWVRLATLELNSQAP